jgi:hypothetical protein
VIGGFCLGQTAVAVGGGACIILGALLSREGALEWSRYEDLEWEQQRDGLRRNLKPRELEKVRLGERAMARVDKRCHCRRSK